MRRQIQVEVIGGKTCIKGETAAISGLLRLTGCVYNNRRKAWVVPDGVDAEQLAQRARDALSDEITGLTQFR